MCKPFYIAPLYVGLGLLTVITLSACGDQAEAPEAGVPGEPHGTAEQVDDTAHGAKGGLAAAGDQAAHFVEDAVHAVEDAGHAITHQAQEWIQSVKQYLADHDLDSAGKVLEKLKAVASELPATVQEKIASLDQRLKAKSEAASELEQAAE